MAKGKYFPQIYYFFKFWEHVLVIPPSSPTQITEEIFISYTLVHNELRAFKLQGIYSCHPLMLSN